MKKIFLTFSLFAATALMLSSCLKDKGFDNHEYGINDPDTQPPGIGFPRATSAKFTIGVDFVNTSQSVDGIVYVNLESGVAASSDVHVTLQLSDALRIAYNAANGTNILALPASAFSVPLTLTIPAGGRNASVPITFPNASLLDPNSTYGVGFIISSVDGGYTIAGNLGKLFVEVGVKNKYDGRYNLKGYHNRAPYTFPFTTTVEMWTTGASSVAMYWPDGADFGQPIGIGPGSVNWYGNAIAPNFLFDPATNLCTGVTQQVNPGTPLGMVTFDAVADNNPDGPIVNRYEPATKKMYLVFQYSNNDLRRFYDTLTYLGPR